ncbi:small EDRK-rich factor 1-like [Myotis myotis]|uniref:small EDRK-rich factor 1-like n=1 Tax=Myotis myotis TaxID=51298 RepID=UPI00174989FC|nr:small EDRK-rich factor 1-like [Myotis myotis]
MCSSGLVWWSAWPVSVRTGWGSGREAGGSPRQGRQARSQGPAGTAERDGGHQRELARQKNMKKSQEISKGKRKEDSLTASRSKQRDSEIMQRKQKAANEKKSTQTREK